MTQFKAVGMFILAPVRGLHIQCTVTTNIKKKATWTAWKYGDKTSDFGYFMRGDAVYRGTFTGGSLKKVTGYTQIKK